MSLQCDLHRLVRGGAAPSTLCQIKEPPATRHVGLPAAEQGETAGTCADSPAAVCSGISALCCRGCTWVWLVSPPPGPCGGGCLCAERWKRTPGEGERKGEKGEIGGERERERKGESEKGKRERGKISVCREMS